MSEAQNRWIYVRAVARHELGQGIPGCQVCQNPVPDGQVFLCHFGQQQFVVCDACRAEMAAAAATPGPAPTPTAPMVVMRPFNAQ